MLRSDDSLQNTLPIIEGLVSEHPPVQPEDVEGTEADLNFRGVAEIFHIIVFA